MKSKLIAAFLLAASAIVISSPLFAHHSSAAYDMEHPVNMKGVVTNMEWTNPHVFIYLDVKDDNGSVEEWRVEGNSPNMLFRAGWRKEMIKAGDQLDGEWRARQKRSESHAAHQPHAGERAKVRRARIQIIRIGDGNGSGVQRCGIIPSISLFVAAILALPLAIFAQTAPHPGPAKTRVCPRRAGFFRRVVYRRISQNHPSQGRSSLSALGGDAVQGTQSSKFASRTPIPDRTRPNDASRRAFRGPCCSRFRGRSCRRATG